MSSPPRVWIVMIVVAIRVAAALALIAGPWTDEAAELDGWDVARFVAIAEADGRPWADHEVEYPPGSVVIIEALTARTSPADRLVTTHRRLVGLSLIVDLSIAAGLWCSLQKHTRRSELVASTYLLLGTALVPAGLLRLDLWAAGLGTLGLLAMWRRRSLTAGAAIAAGALVKIFPVVLVAVAVAGRRFRSAAWAVAFGAVSGAAWLAYGGFDALEQVLSLRGATGWHVESVPGSLAVLAGESARFEADAYRVGQINEAVVAAGRILFVGVVGALGWGLYSRASRVAPSGSSTEPKMADLEAMATMIAGAIAALVLTAPLLSPQFLLWLTPWLAIQANRRTAWVGGATIALTAGVLGVFGPPGVDQVLPAVLLLVRDAGLAAVVWLCWKELCSPKELGSR